MQEIHRSPVPTQLWPMTRRGGRNLRASPLPELLTMEYAVADPVSEMSSAAFRERMPSETHPRNTPPIS